MNEQLQASAIYLHVAGRHFRRCQQLDNQASAAHVGAPRAWPAASCSAHAPGGSEPLAPVPLGNVIGRPSRRAAERTEPGANSARARLQLIRGALANSEPSFSLAKFNFECLLLGTRRYPAIIEQGVPPKACRALGARLPLLAGLAASAPSPKLMKLNNSQPMGPARLPARPCVYASVLKRRRSTGNWLAFQAHVAKFATCARRN